MTRAAARVHPAFWLLNVAVFFAALVGGCWAIHRTLPAPWISVVSPKLQYLLNHGDDVEILFIGSSLTNRGINPKRFDSVMESGGNSTHSFNVAADGMRFPETFYLLDKIAEMPLPQLKWVLMESDVMGVETDDESPRNRRGKPGPRERHRGTARSVYWHDLRNTALFLEKLCVLENQRAKKTGERFRFRKMAVELYQHAEEFVKNEGNLGRLTQELQPSQEGSPFQTATVGKKEFTSTKRGFLGIDLAMQPKDTKHLLAWIKREKANPAPRFIQDKLTENAILRTARRLKQRGTQLVLLVPPDASHIKAGYDGLQETRSLKTFFYLDPEAYPQLYDPQNRHNDRHLNKSGAEIFSEILANDFSDYLASGK